MIEFIARHPGLTYSSLLTLIALIVYFYKGNESKAALLIAGKLDTIAEKLDGLYSKDAERKRDIKDLSIRTAKLETCFATQVQRCNDREMSCPGKQAHSILDRMRDRQRDAIEKERVKDA